MKTPTYILKAQRAYYKRNREKILQKRAEKYRTDAAFRQRVHERYEKEKQAIHEEYMLNKQNPEFRKRRAEINHRYYLKKKERKDARTENQI